MQLYQPQFALVELLNGREVEVTAFRANNGNPLSLWLLDLPGVTLNVSSLFINNVQAEKLRSAWDKALTKSEPTLSALPCAPVGVTPAIPAAATINPYCNPMHASMTVSAVLEEFLAYKNTGDIKLASEGKTSSRRMNYCVFSLLTGSKLVQEHLTNTDLTRAFARFTTGCPYWHYMWAGASMSFASFIWRTFVWIKTVLPILILILMHRIR
jgi:hypothetical protein